MIEKCTICNEVENKIIYNKRLPIVEYTNSNNIINDAFFNEIQIVCCNNCGHGYNQSFNKSSIENLYEDAPLPANPVNPKMQNRLHHVLEWLGEKYYKDKKIIEIGSGSGQLARLLASESKMVTVFEPCKTLTTKMMPEKNINLFSQNYSYNPSLGLFDLAICRQVIEHIDNPINFINQIKKSLKPNGFAYLEVPSAEYIYSNKMIYDFHYQHIQYFTKHSFIRAAEQVGFKLIKYQKLMDGHDMGFIFSNLSSNHKKLNDIKNNNEIIKQENYQLTLNNIIDLVNNIDGSIALYGANTHGQMFLNLISEFDENIIAVIDDSEYLDNYYLFNKNKKLRIIDSKSIDINQFENIIITAYLHENSIKTNLDKLGFKGKIFSIIPNKLKKG